MVAKRTRLSASTTQSELAASLAAWRAQLGVPNGYPADAEHDAELAAARLGDPTPHGTAQGDLPDWTDIEFLTIDPAGSMDLDQALHLTRGAHGGYVLHYAIADVPWFVAPGGPLDEEARRRGQTLYAPDGRAPLHPLVLSEGAASLLPGQRRRAFVWRIETDAQANATATSVTRAIVSSRHRWSYDEAQAAFDAGTAPESIALMRAFGEGRQTLESARGGASLGSPEDDIVFEDGAYTIRRRTMLPIEDWNAQLSLLTGMAAADLMLAGRVGIIRTMPPATDAEFGEFRARTVALGLPWRHGVRYGDYLRGLDGGSPAALAVMRAATGLFRGAGYAAFDGAPPAHTAQAAIAAPYAHVTAPLRRLVDRWALVVAEAIANGREVPGWARESLPSLPAIMAASDSLASRLGAGAVDRVEAALLASRVGEVFDAVVVSQSKAATRFQLTAPDVTATLDGLVGTPGGELRLRLLSADISTGVTNWAPA